MTLLALHEGRIATPFNDGPAWAVTWSGNLLVEPFGPADHKMLGSRVVSYSGWLGLEDADPVRGVFARDPRSWGPGGWLGLASALDAAVPGLTERGQTLVLRPHARHPLSDPQRCLTLLRQREGQPIGVLLDPIAMLEPSMIGTVEDHLDRALGALAGHAGVHGVVLTSAEVVSQGEDQALVPVPIGQGVIDVAVLRAAVHRHVPVDKPVVLLANSLEDQSAALGRGR